MPIATRPPKDSESNVLTNNTDSGLIKTETYSPMDLNVGDVSGKSIGWEVECIAKITIVVQHYKNFDKIKPIAMFKHANSVAPEQILDFLDQARKNIERNLEAIKRENERLGYQ